jgi:hypothetical protein
MWDLARERVLARRGDARHHRLISSDRLISSGRRVASSDGRIAALPRRLAA